jgi:hypothetical protein
MDNLWEYLMPVLGTIVTGAIGWGAMAFQAWSGYQIEAKHREALHSAIMTGIGFARSKLTGSGPAIDEKQVVIQAKEYVERSVPDALRHFGLDKAAGNLAEMIASKLANAIL